jgi:hypothetical protein
MFQSRVMTYLRASSSQSRVLRQQGSQRMLGSFPGRVRTGLALGTGIAAALLIPDQAKAADECGPPPPGGGTIECPPKDDAYRRGIDYGWGTGQTADLTLVLTSGAGVHVLGDIFPPPCRPIDPCYQQAPPPITVVNRTA